MSTTNAAVTAPRERLSWKEICARYPDEWVVVAETVPDDDDESADIEFESALLLAHDTRRKEAYRLLAAHLAAHGGVGCYFTGKIRELSPRLR